MRHPLSALTLALLLSPALALTCPAQIVLHEVDSDPVGVDEGAEKIELYNASANAVPLARWAIFLDNITTQTRHIYVFDAARTIQPGAYLTLHWRGTGTGDAQNAYTASEGSWYGGGDENIANDAFGLSLFEDDNDRFVGPDFSDSSKIRDFLQTGDDFASRESIAINAGMWMENDVIVDRGEGISLVKVGDGDSSTDYFGDIRGFVPGDNAIPVQPAFTYGSSCAGSGDFEPIIPPTTVLPADSSRFQVSLINGLGPLSFLVIGYQQDAVPFGPTCTLWTSFDFLVGPLVMQGGPGQGEGRITLDTFNPAPGSQFDVYLTFFCQDASTSKGFTLSNALALRL